MGGKQMEGDNRERRKQAKESRDSGQAPSETGATQGASQQRTRSGSGASHQEKVDLKREGKPDQISETTSEARPGSRDADSPDRERHPRRD